MTDYLKPRAEEERRLAAEEKKKRDEQKRIERELAEGAHALPLLDLSPAPRWVFRNSCCFIGSSKWRGKASFSISTGPWAILCWGGGCWGWGRKAAVGRGC